MVATVSSLPLGTLLLRHMPLQRRQALPRFLFVGHCRHPPDRYAEREAQNLEARVKNSDMPAKCVGLINIGARTRRSLGHRYYYEDSFGALYSMYQPHSLAQKPPPTPRFKPRLKRIIRWRSSCVILSRAAPWQLSLSLRMFFAFVKQLRNDSDGLHGGSRADASSILDVVNVSDLVRFRVFIMYLSSLSEEEFYRLLESLLYRIRYHIFNLININFIHFTYIRLAKK